MTVAIIVGIAATRVFLSDKNTIEDGRIRILSQQPRDHVTTYERFSRGFVVLLLYFYSLHRLVLQMP